MAGFLSQRRTKLTGVEENKADHGGSTDQKIPIQKTQTFKAEKKKGQNWFLKFARKMGRDYDSSDVEEQHAAAVAAAALAIDEQEDAEQSKSETHEGSFTKIKSKVDGRKSPISLLGSVSKRFSGSFRTTDDQSNKVPISSVSDEKKPEKAMTPAPSRKKSSSFTDKIPETPAPKVPPPPPPPPPTRQASTKPGPARPPTPPGDTTMETPTEPGIGETKADEWERAELEKIRERYEKLKKTIDSWENKKVVKAKRKLNMEESELERRRLKALENFQNDMKHIYQIANGARAKAEEGRINEEQKAKENANVIRRTGKLPGICSCF